MHTGKHLLTSEKNKQKGTDQKHVCFSGKENNTPLLKCFCKRTQEKIRKIMFKEQRFRSGAADVALGVKMFVL